MEATSFIQHYITNQEGTSPRKFAIVTFVSALGKFRTYMNMVKVTVRFRNKEDVFSGTPMRNYLAYIILVEIIAIAPTLSPNILNS